MVSNVTAVSQFRQESQMRLQTVAKHAIAEQLDWNLRGADELCESELEKLFLMAWLEKLEEYKLAAPWNGWMSQYHIAGGHTCGVVTLESILIEKLFHPLIEHYCGISLLDFVLPQQTIANHTVDFVLIRLRYSFEEINGERELCCREYPKLIVECDDYSGGHQSVEQELMMKSRDLTLQKAGFYVFRFSESELTQSPSQCAQEVADFFGSPIE